MIKKDIIRILVKVAKSKYTIPYSDLVKELKREMLEANSPALHDMLGEISETEGMLGRGLLSALVVNKEEMKPGKGFFTMAKNSFGLDILDNALWIDSINYLYEYWADNPTLTQVSADSMIRLEGGKSCEDHYYR